MAVSIIGGGNHEQNLNSQLWWHRHTACIGSCKANYHTIMTRTAPNAFKGNKPQLLTMTNDLISCRYYTSV